MSPRATAWYVTAQRSPASGAPYDRMTGRPRASEDDWTNGSALPPGYSPVSDTRAKDPRLSSPRRILTNRMLTSGDVSPTKVCKSDDSTYFDVWSTVHQAHEALEMARTSLNSVEAPTPSFTNGESVCLGAPTMEEATHLSKALRWSTTGRLLGDISRVQHDLNAMCAQPHSKGLLY